MTDSPMRIVFVDPDTVEDDAAMEELVAWLTGDPGPTAEGDE